MNIGIKALLRRAIAPWVRRWYAFAQDIIESDLPAFANRPKNLRIELPRRISESHRIHVGDDVRIGPNSLLVAQTYYPSEVMRHPLDRRPPQCFDPKIVIGDRVTATGSLTLAAMHLITIEDDVMFAGNVMVSDGLHGYMRADEPYKYQPMWRIAAVTIKRGCWLGQNVVVMPGVTIGECAIIGANSVVTHDIPARSIAVGCPARVVKQWDDGARCWRSAAREAATV